MHARVEAVHLCGEHTFSKASQPEVELVAGMGVVGDAHFGATVRHRSRVAADPSQPAHVQPIERGPGHTVYRVNRSGCPAE